MPVIARWWWLLLLGTIAASVAGYAVVTNVPKTYEAEAQGIVGPINAVTDLESSGALARTYAELATTQPVLTQAINVTGSRLTPKELNEAMTVSANDVTRIVSISVESREPRRAAKLANAIMRSLRSQSAQIEDSSKTLLEQVKAQPEYEALESRVQRRVDRLILAGSGPSPSAQLSIIEAALPPELPAKPEVPIVVLLSAVGGLLTTATIVLFREAQRLSLRENEESEPLATIGREGAPVPAPVDRAAG